MSENEAQQPVTRSDLRELKEYLAGALVKQNEYLAEALVKHEAKTQEFVRDAQTEILRAFHAFESAREIRFARLKAEVSNLDQEANGRIDNIEKRLMAVEERLILGPPRQ